MAGGEQKCANIGGTERRATERKEWATKWRTGRMGGVKEMWGGGVSTAKEQGGKRENGENVNSIIFERAIKCT